MIRNLVFATAFFILVACNSSDTGSQKNQDSCFANPSACLGGNSGGGNSNSNGGNNGSSDDGGNDDGGTPGGGSSPRTACVPCDGTMGNFNVCLTEPSTVGGNYKLDVLPSTVASDGSIVSAYIVNATPAYEQIISQTVLHANTALPTQDLTPQQFATYDIFALVPYDPSTPFLDQEPEEDAICYLPTFTP